ncbi:hypothetical protein [Aromatoleum evansii]|uniref:Lipoprotein n=1 Tax=Aromatoleum evansii TaxID=59406 RepID=A0ABZ1AJ76_AROEV|nr:hypothetical protein [Aromatoleum evansii]NMG28132.1 hypothetical protein [Aromatoleum evansii]WRL44632.1 hypothetical protein U5817_15615 [Aromatoleum evansii]
MARLLTAILVATLLGGCIVLPVGHGGYRHHDHSWGERHHDGGHRYWSDRDGSWRYRERR